MDRYFTNQPSTSQPAHAYHGCRVFAKKDGPNHITAYFAENGPIGSIRLSPLALSPGWPGSDRQPGPCTSPRGLVALLEKELDKSMGQRSPMTDEHLMGWSMIHLKQALWLIQDTLHPPVFIPEGSVNIEHETRLRDFLK